MFDMIKMYKLQYSDGSLEPSEYNFHGEASAASAARIENLLPVVDQNSIGESEIS